MQGVTTNPSIFLRLKQSDPTPREFAWGEFHSRYAPIIAGFAHRLGARPQDLDDIVQDVLLGFFSTSPAFVYDPAKGRFRGYLKVCTWRAVRTHVGKEVRFGGVPLDQIDPEAVAIEHVRGKMGETKTFQAFEQYVALNQPAQSVADTLGVHIMTVYQSKKQITRLLRETVRRFNEED